MRGRCRALLKWWKRINTKSSPAVENKAAWRLTPLTPEYIDSEHSDYVHAINAAIDNAQVRNIALSGNYGVGKSSILQKVARQHKTRVVELSLSTLAPIEASNLDGSVPKQATTATNRIQQEIVKQLLYREEPHKTPGSRFQRIERFCWCRELTVAPIAGLAVAVIFLLTGWTEQIANELMPLPDLGAWKHLIILVVATGIALVLRRLFYGRVHIGQISAGSATVTLDKKSVSYFDQYLDEIVYFFEVSDRDILIFEDIDRFDDSLIFETLRSLNTLLNSSPQLKNTIRFIYAIKDSIFDQTSLEQNGRSFKQDGLEFSDPAQAEVVRANRTKFFDLVIPVVPFITHRSARNLVVQLLGEVDHKIEDDLIDLASRYVPDMRLLKNVRNEFIVFHNRVFSGDGEQLNLSKSELFAMILYKNTHLADFEEIRLGRSKLDQLYDVSRQIVAANIQRIEGEARTIRYRLASLNGIVRHSSMLGGMLIEHVERTVRAAGDDIKNGQLLFNGKVNSHEDLKSSKFWSEFVLEVNEPMFRWVRNNYHHHSYQINNLSFTRPDLEAALNTSFEQEYWDKSAQAELEEAITELSDDLKVLRSADMNALIERRDFLTQYGGSEKCFDAIACELLREGLAYQLVRAGYINRNFTLYTSTFHGDCVSTAATNFIIHHVERNIMDEYFMLDGADVDAVIRECGKKALGEPALYNIAILDHLLRTDVDAANIMIRSFISFGADQKRFLQAYLTGTNEHILFIKRFVNATPKALAYLVSQIELDESRRMVLMDSVLANLANDVEYQANPVVAKYLKANYAELSTLTSALLDNAKAELIAKVFKAAGVLVPTLEPLSEIVRQAFVAQNLYEVNRDNLTIALGSDVSLALDSIREVDESIYSYVIENLNAYLSAINGISATVDSESRFIEVIEDVLANETDQLRQVIAQASEKCRVNDLTQLSGNTWPFLAECERFPSTFSNINNYIKSIGELDANLAKVLISAKTITENANAEEEDKVLLAYTILLARKHLPSPAFRVELVTSLQLRTYLDVMKIPAEQGELFALLLKHNFVQDVAETYNHLLGMDWPTRESYIRVSTEFKNYIAPALLQGDLSAFLLSNKVGLVVKMAVLEQASEYIAVSREIDLTELASFAAKQNYQLTLDVVTKLAASHASTDDVIVLLKPHLLLLPREELFSILQSMGGTYMQLASLGRGKLKLLDSPANIALLDMLKLHGIVSTYSRVGRDISINKKRK